MSGPAQRLFALIGRHAASAMVVGVLAGLAIPPLAEALFPLVGPLILIILSGSLLRLDWGVLGAYRRDPRLPSASVAWLLLAYPLLGWLAAALLPLPSGLATSLVLNAATPPLMGAPAMALILGLDAELTAVTVVVVTLAFPATLMALLAAGAIAVSVEFGAVAARIGLMIGVPVAIGLFGQIVIGRETLARHKTGFDAVMVTALVLIAVALMHGANVALAADPAAALMIGGVALLFNLVGQMLSAAVFWRAGLGRAMAMAIMGGNRNLGLTLGITAGFLGPDFAAYVAFAQLPIYFTPVVLKQVLRRLRR